MAGIRTIKECVKICKLANVTPMIWGHRGIGKSSSQRQLCEENTWGIVDTRCSQLEASDLRGLPERFEGRTRFLPPSDMPIGDWSIEKVKEHIGKMPVREECGSDAEYSEQLRMYNIRWVSAQPRYPSGILFLDELNRAQDDVLQAAFQLVLDGRIGQYSLPPGWSVVAAGNFNEGYQTNGFNDPAFLDRFCHLIMDDGETTLEEWVEYMSDTHGSNASEVIEFATQNIRHLDGDMTGELGFTIKPSRRSWDMVARVLEAVKTEKFSERAKDAVIAGIVGRDLATAFARYNCPVKPMDLLKHGVNNYRHALTSLERNQLIGLMWGMVSFCKGKVDDDNVAKVCLDFAEHMCDNSNDKDIVVSFCRAMVSDKTGDSDKVRTATISNPKLAQIMAKFAKKDGKKDFIDRLNERPRLQEALSHSAWGN